MRLKRHWQRIDLKGRKNEKEDIQEVVEIKLSSTFLYTSFVIQAQILAHLLSAATVHSNTQPEREGHGHSADNVDGDVSVPINVSVLAPVTGSIIGSIIGSLIGSFVDPGNVSVLAISSYVGVQSFHVQNVQSDLVNVSVTNASANVPSGDA